MMSLLWQALKCVRSGRAPTRRALATLAKLNGARLERRWPFLIKASSADLNLDFEDVLELQRWRSAAPVVVVIGAFDGVTNDPTGEFIRTNRCRAILVEPQPGPFARLQRTYESVDGVSLVNAAVDERTGFRTLYAVAAEGGRLPDWTEQIASFDRRHVLKHQDLAPGVADNLVEIRTPTVTFEELIATYRLTSIDVLQIDAEGMDALLLGWFPFEKVRPGVVHYEVAHMDETEARQVGDRLASFGYRLAPIRSSSDAVAVAL